MSPTPQEDYEGMPKEIRHAAIFSLAISFILFSMKFLAFKMTGSQAIFSDAMESIVNILTAIFGLGVLYYASKPADDDHPYGHGKIEYLSAGAEGGLIGFAAFLIATQAVQALYERQPLQDLNYGLLIIAVAGIVNFFVGVYLKKVGQKNGSVALQASGRHLIADFWTSGAIIVGLGFVVVTSIWWLDSVIALLVCVHLGFECVKMVREAIGGLLDEGEQETLERIHKLVKKYPAEGIIQIHHVRVMRAGRFHHIDAHVVVPEFWSVEKAHDETIKYEKTLFDNYEYAGEFHFHIDPCRRLYCKFCDVKECPVRTEKFVNRREPNLSELTNKDEPF